MPRPHPGRLATSAALLLAALVLLAGAVPAHANAGAGALTAAEIQPGNDDLAVTVDEEFRSHPPESGRDRRVIAALIFTVIGTIGLITIGSIVLLTQPGDRQVMVVVEPEETPAQAPEESITGGTPEAGKTSAPKRHVSQ